MRRKPPTEPRTIPTTTPGLGPELRLAYVVGMATIVCLFRREDMELVIDCTERVVIWCEIVGGERGAGFRFEVRWSSTVIAARSDGVENEREGNGAMVPMDLDLCQCTSEYGRYIAGNG